MKRATERFDAIVIGTGAGGAITAAHLAEAGLRVLILEEGGESAPVGNTERFTLEGMNRRLRRGGQQVAFGYPLLAWGEGIGVGGGTAINSGLYHRLPDTTLQHWVDRHRIVGLDTASLEVIYTEIEQALHVALNPVGLSPAAALLANGADQLGMRWREIPRWVRHTETGPVRITMQDTYLRRAIDAGAELRTASRVQNLVSRDGNVHGIELSINGRLRYIAATTTFVCAGAVESSRLLLRSRIGSHVGKGLQFHPMVKLAALFNEPVNEAHDMGAVQVLQHAPRITIGAAASAPAVLGAALGRSTLLPTEIAERWERSLLWYAAISPKATGRVHRNGTVSFQLRRRDLDALYEGARHVAELAFAAGAVDVTPSCAGGHPVTTTDEVITQLTRSSMDLTSVHVSSGLAMGEDRARSSVNSWGRPHGTHGLIVNDASILPGAPGVNPQGIVMALATRNVRHYLEESR